MKIASLEYVKRGALGVAVAGAFAAGSAQAVATGADVMTLIDESGSMDDEHAWIPSMIQALDTSLVSSGVTGNRYGLTGFGSNDFADGVHNDIDDTIEEPHKHPVGGGDFGSSSELATAANDSLVLSGGEEDGWWALDFALSEYSYRSDAARNFILITDEGRENQMTEAGLTSATFDGLSSSLSSVNGLLNVVVDANFRCGDGTENILGLDAGGTGYVADGDGGFTTCDNATGIPFTGDGNTFDAYVDLALESGGAAWDLNRLRDGGVTADSFTSAFVDIKVSEIQEQDPGGNGTVPLPATLSLLGLGLLGLRVARGRF